MIVIVGDLVAIVSLIVDGTLDEALIHEVAMTIFMFVVNLV